MCNEPLTPCLVGPSSLADDYDAVVLACFTGLGGVTEMDGPTLFIRPKIQSIFHHSENQSKIRSVAAAINSHSAHCPLRKPFEGEHASHPFYRVI
jgi:hypothetical protein